MQGDPQTKAVADELKKLNRTMEALNANLAAFVNAFAGKDVDTVQTKPTIHVTQPHPYFDRTPTHITPPGADPYGTQR